MTPRLDQARRISALRERRSERVRQEASLHARDCAARAKAAEEASQQRSQERAAAERLLIADPGDPQAQLWRMLARQEEQSAAEHSAQAETLLITAHNDAETARNSHERDCERTRLLDGRILAAAALEERLAEEREAEEMQSKLS